MKKQQKYFIPSSSFIEPSIRESPKKHFDDNKTVQITPKKEEKQGFSQIMMRTNRFKIEHFEEFHLVDRTHDIYLKYIKSIENEEEEFLDALSNVVEENTYKEDEEKLLTNDIIRTEEEDEKEPEINKPGFAERKEYTITEGLHTEEEDEKESIPVSLEEEEIPHQESTYIEEEDKKEPVPVLFDQQEIPNQEGTHIEEEDKKESEESIPLSLKEEYIPHQESAHIEEEDNKEPKESMPVSLEEESLPHQESTHIEEEDKKESVPVLINQQEIPNQEGIHIEEEDKKEPKESIPVSLDEEEIHNQDSTQIEEEDKKESKESIPVSLEEEGLPHQESTQIEEEDKKEPLELLPEFSDVEDTPHQKSNQIAEAEKNESDVTLLEKTIHNQSEAKIEEDTKENQETVPTSLKVPGQEGGNQKEVMVEDGKISNSFEKSNIDSTKILLEEKLNENAIFQQTTHEYPEVMEIESIENQNDLHLINAIGNEEEDGSGIPVFQNNKNEDSLDNELLKFFDEE